MQVGATERENTMKEGKVEKNERTGKARPILLHLSFVHWFFGQCGESGCKLCLIRAFESLMRSHTHKCLRGLTHIHTHNLCWMPSCSEGILSLQENERTKNSDKCESVWTRFKSLTLNNLLSSFFLPFKLLLLSSVYTQRATLISDVSDSCVLPPLVLD